MSFFPWIQPSEVQSVSFEHDSRQATKSKPYIQSKWPLNKNQSSKFCQSGVKQTHFQNLKGRKKEIYHRGTLNKTCIFSWHWHTWISSTIPQVSLTTLLSHWTFLPSNRETLFIYSRWTVLPTHNYWEPCQADATAWPLLEIQSLKLHNLQQCWVPNKIWHLCPNRTQWKLQQFFKNLYQIANKHVIRVGEQGRSDQVEGNKQFDTIAPANFMWEKKKIFCFIHPTASGK